jgi:hypothetical protein
MDHLDHRHPDRRRDRAEHLALAPLSIVVGFGGVDVAVAGNRVTPSA